ncbi:hypothetical protein DFP72DRAFT_1049717 [Ephemerocybe angulata]|uniref:Uncharacterized protein n=1 Tax=Ephemerocybe angulata TaxID=980116 RepID=A0A8H6M1H2_9AGAR|nr:hypothetical protein DFP72DRAFT_1049717 [Tulosesus angulatus]
MPIRTGHTSYGIYPLPSNGSQPYSRGRNIDEQFNLPRRTPKFDPSEVVGPWESNTKRKVWVPYAVPDATLEVFGSWVVTCVGELAEWGPGSSDARGYIARRTTSGTVRVGEAKESGRAKAAIDRRTGDRMGSVWTHCLGDLMDINQECLAIVRDYCDISANTYYMARVLPSPDFVSEDMIQCADHYYNQRWASFSLHWPRATQLVPQSPLEKVDWYLAHPLCRALRNTSARSQNRFPTPQIPETTQGPGAGHFKCRIGTSTNDPNFAFCIYEKVCAGWLSRQSTPPGILSICPASVPNPGPYGYQNTQTAYFDGPTGNSHRARECSDARRRGLVSASGDVGHGPLIVFGGAHAQIER